MKAGELRTIIRTELRTIVRTEVRSALAEFFAGGGPPRVAFTGPTSAAPQGTPPSAVLVQPEVSAELDRMVRERLFNGPRKPSRKPR